MIEDVEAVGYLVPLVAFVALFVLLHVRARRHGEAQTIQWRWLAAIFGCAGAAILLGALL